MVVAVIAVSVVQMAFDQVIHVVAVRNGFVPAPGAVAMVASVFTAIVRRRAVRGVRCVDLDLMFLDAAGGVMVQMAVVEVVDVAIVLNAGMPAPRSVLVRVVGVVSVAHAETPSIMWATWQDRRVITGLAL